MVGDWPYHLFLRLGAILLPILAGIVVWSYYRGHATRPPRPTAAIAVPSTENPLKSLDLTPELRAGEQPAPVAAAPSAGVSPALPTSFAGPSAAEAEAMRKANALATPPGVAAPIRGAARPPRPATSGQPASTGNRPKARDARKEEARSVSSQKLDKELDRKLSICSGC
jgi:hypothetical protein